MPTNSEESNYSYKAFWWNPELLQPVKMWDIKPNAVEATALVINEDLSTGAFEGTATARSDSIILQNAYSISSFTQVPSEPIWNYSNVSGASIVNGALRLTPRSDAYYTDTYPKGLELAFQVNERDFAVETLIGIPSASTSYYGRIGISFIDDSGLEVGFAGLYDASSSYYPTQKASIITQSWTSNYLSNAPTQVKVKVERINSYGSVYIDDVKVLSNVYWPSNITKIVFTNSRYSGSSYYYSYMDIKSLRTGASTEQFIRTSPEYSLPLSTMPSTTLITWVEETNAANATIQVYTNVFDGNDWLGWKQCTNGGQIPDIDLAILNWPNVKIQTKQIMNLPSSSTNLAGYLSLSNLAIVVNTSQPERTNTFVKPLNKVFIGWPEDYTQVYTDYIGVAKADPVSFSYKLKNNCVYVKIDGKLTKQRAIRIPYQYIRTLDKRNALVGFCKPEEWEAAT